MNKIIHKPRNNFSTQGLLSQDLKENWITADKLHNECDLENKIAQYYGNLRIREVTVLIDDLLILQRVIGYPTMVGN